MREHELFSKAGNREDDSAITKKREIWGKKSSCLVNKYSYVYSVNLEKK